MKLKILSVATVLVGATTLPAWGGINKISDTVVDAEALTIKGSLGQCINGLSFQQDALSSYKGYQYVAFYDAGRRVCLARRKLPDGAWAVIRFRDYTFRSNDAHNTISLGLCPQPYPFLQP